jgi:hypothetical protein
MSNSGIGMSFIFIYFGTLILYVMPFVKYITGMFRACKVVQPASRKCVVAACWHNVDRLYPVKQVIKEFKMKVCNS